LGLELRFGALQVEIRAGSARAILVEKQNHFTAEIAERQVSEFQSCARAGFETLKL